LVYPNVLSNPFPTRRSSDLVVLISGRPARELLLLSGIHPHPEIWGSHGFERLKPDGSYELAVLPRDQQMGLLMAVTSLRSDDLEDRKSTRLNSSHYLILYAV